MRVLLDTHMLIWILNGYEHLIENREFMDLYMNEIDDIYFSAISIWEIELKKMIGKANFTYAYTQNRTWNRQTNATYSRDPGTTVTESTGMFLDRLNSGYTTTQYYATNVYGTYDNMFGQHHFTATAGFNFETSRVEAASLSGQNLMSEELNNYALLGTSADGTVVTVNFSDEPFTLPDGETLPARGHRVRLGRRP